MGVIRGGDGDNAGLGPGAQPLSGDTERLTSDADIFCTDREEGDGLYVSARVLSYASTAVKRHITRIMRQDSGYAAAAVQGAVMSVLHQHARADLKGSTRAGTHVSGLLLAEKPLTVGGFA